MSIVEKRIFDSYWIPTGPRRRCLHFPMTSLRMRESCDKPTCPCPNMIVLDRNLPVWLCTRLLCSLQRKDQIRYSQIVLQLVSSPSKRHRSLCRKNSSKNGCVEVLILQAAFTNLQCVC